MRTRGWKKVFSFTVIQYIKTKSFIIGTIIAAVIVMALCVLTNMLPVWISSSKESEPAAAEKEYGAVYITDESEILTSADYDAAAEMFKIEKTDRKPDDVIEELSKKDGGVPEAFVIITREKDAQTGLDRYFTKVYYSAGSGSSAANTLGGYFSMMIDKRNLANLGVKEEDYEKTQISITTAAVEAGATEIDMITGMLNYFVPIVFSLILFIMIFAYGNQIAQSIATEKTSRVMELLLTSVRPLAIVIGKVLAMALVSIGQFLLTGLIGAASFAVTAPIGFGGQIGEILSNPDVMNSLNGIQGGNIAAGGYSSAEIGLAQALDDIASRFNPANIILIIIIFLLGFIFYALIAALVGASISRIEDLQAAMQPYSLLGVLGVYLSFFPIAFNMDSFEAGVAATNPVQIFSYYFPVSSPFSLPSAVLLGQLDTAGSILAVAILAVCVMLIAVIVGKVYEAIVLHNGSRIKFGDIIKMAARK